MDWMQIVIPIISSSIVGLLAYFGGRAQARKLNIEGSVLTLDKVNELLEKLIAAKEEMIGLKTQIADLGRDSKELAELKKRILEICEEVEIDTNRAISMLMSVKRRIES